jgi:hypothetical protein
MNRDIGGPRSVVAHFRDPTERVPPFRFMVPMHAKKRKRASHEPYPTAYQELSADTRWLIFLCLQAVRSIKPAPTVHNRSPWPAWVASGAGSLAEASEEIGVVSDSAVCNVTRARRMSCP